MFQARDMLIYLSLICEGDTRKMVDLINLKVEIDEKDMEEKLSNRNFKCITILDNGYPDLLKEVPLPPLVLYYEGDISLIYNIKDNISVVGSRDCSSYGKGITENIVSNLCKKYVIVSGMANGIDSIAHQSSLDNHGKTIAVLGCGTNICFPNNNLKLMNQIKKEGLVISEYPPNTPPLTFRFPQRNRIIAGLGNSLLVTEAKIKSGTAITVNYALSMGKEVFCVPHQVGSQGEGCNFLIHEGAFLIQKAQDIFDYFEDIK